MPITHAADQPSHRHAQSRSWTAHGAAVVLFVLGFLPIASWVAGQRPGPEYLLAVREWGSGSAIAILAGVVLAIVSRHVPALWPSSVTALVTRGVTRAPRTLLVVVAALTTSLALAGAVHLFNTRPILIDEIVQVRQAQIFAGGHLWLPLPAHPEFVSSLLMVDLGGRVYSQFPPGGPAMLALGQLVSAPWIVNPIVAGLSVIAFANFVRVAEPRVGVRAAAVLLFALAPFALFMSASHMNHVTALLWILVASASLARAMASETPRTALAFLSGLGFGIAATIRPADALAFALPGAAWYLRRAVRQPSRWHDALAALAGVLIPLCAMMLVNNATTGDPLRFGYAVLWGQSHALGFHQAPWGPVHTPLRGLSYINDYLLQLQRYLFETPIPSLLPAALALVATARVRAADRYLLASSALLLLLYFAYFHQGYYLGPRFVFPLLPAAALWTARIGPVLEARLGGRVFVYRSAAYALAVSGIMAAAIGIPVRATAYAHSAATERWATPHAAADAGVHGALVFVRESWDSQLVTRMWALGVSRPDAERLFAHVDACRLELAIQALEQQYDATPASRDFDATGSLLPLLSDSAAVRPTLVAPGLSVATQRGYTPAPVCIARVREMLDGITPLAPMLVLNDGNVYVRDLHERDSLVRAMYPGRPIYVLHSAGLADDAVPTFYRSRGALVVSR